MTWIMLISALLLGIQVTAQEWMIKKRPYWMRCRCFVLKRYCSCPSGTREEIEQLDDHVWDKVRASYWGLLAVYFLLPAFQAAFSAIIFLRWMGYLEGRLPEGFSMNARRSMKGEALLWVAFLSSSASALCMVVKWLRSRRPKGWMEDQNLPPLGAEDGVRHIGGDRREARHRGRYTD